MAPGYQHVTPAMGSILEGISPKKFVHCLGWCPIMTPCLKFFFFNSYPLRLTKVDDPYPLR